MNERIRQLMEEAGIYDFVVESMGIDKEMNKFAELIVQECAEVVKWTPSMFPNDTIIKNIKKHFGVEE